MIEVKRIRTEGEGIKTIEWDAPKPHKNIRTEKATDTKKKRHGHQTDVRSYKRRAVYVVERNGKVIATKTERSDAERLKRRLESGVIKEI